MTAVPRHGGTLLVIGWARMPRQAASLFKILEGTRDDELITLMTSVGGPSGHIAWAEYGRRKYGIQFGLESGSARPVIVSTPQEKMS